MRTIRVRRLLLLLCVLLPLSCKESTGLSDDVQIYPLPTAVALVNSSDQALFSFVIDEEYAALLDLMPCIEDACGLVAPKSTRLVRDEDIYSGRVSGAVRVYYWRVALGVDDEAVPGPVSWRRVQLDPRMIR